MVPLPTPRSSLPSLSVPIVSCLGFAAASPLSLTTAATISDTAAFVIAFEVLFLSAFDSGPRFSS